jgi:hypothetical protein
MATKGRSKSRKMRKATVIPAELSLKYVLPGDGNDVYIDIARDLARINRRGYNQGFVYGVAGVTVRQDAIVSTGNQGVNVTFKTAPITWVAVQAYIKAREAWFRQQTRVRKETGQVGIKPAYEDFKIYMDSGHRAGTTLNTLDGAGNPVVNGEWDYSKLVYADQTVDPEVVKEPFVHLVGADVALTDVGLINAYEDSRSTVRGEMPNVPGAASDNIYTLLTSGSDEGATKEIVANMEFDNDSPPYSIEHYAGGVVNYPTNVDKCYVQTSASNPIVSTPSFGLICGLLRVYSQGRTANLDTGVITDLTIPATIVVHLAPGTYKGVGAIPVGDFS